MSSDHHVTMGQLRTKTLFNNMDQTKQFTEDAAVAYCRMQMSIHREKNSDAKEYKHITRLVTSFVTFSHFVHHSS